MKHKQIKVEIELSLDASLDIEEEVERLMLSLKSHLRPENYLESSCIEELPE